MLTFKDPGRVFFSLVRWIFRRLPLSAGEEYNWQNGSEREATNKVSVKSPFFKMLLINYETNQISRFASN